MILLSREYPSDLSQLGEMRTFVADACRDAWGACADEDAIRELQLALNEAVSNIICHAYGSETGRPILLVIEAGADRVCLTLYHHGRGFDPEAVEPPAFDGSRTGGFGLYLIRRVTDEVTFFHDEQGRCGIRMVKRRPAPAPAPDAATE